MYQCHVSIHSNGIYIQSNRLVYHHSEYAQVSHTDKSPFSHSIKAVVLHVCLKSISFRFGDVQLSPRKCCKHEWTWMRIQELNFTGLFHDQTLLDACSERTSRTKVSQTVNGHITSSRWHGEWKGITGLFTLFICRVHSGLFFFYYFVCRHFSLPKIVWRNWNFGERTCRSGITRGVGFTRYSRPTA